MLKKIRIATRQSPLALWQAEYVRKLLAKKWPNLTIDLLPLVTSGDRFLKEKLLVAGGKGLFVKELEEALLAGRAEIAVHSTKDMPVTLPLGLTLAAICKRHNPLDALVSKNQLSLDQLPQHAVIGTASLRRQSQLLAYRTDFQIKTVRGNIHTRLAKLHAGEYDALILAAAGLERMEMQHCITQLLPAEIMLPSCGQGALCIESRINDEEIGAVIACLNDPVSALCVQVERKVNRQLGGNCHVPLAVFCIPTSTNQLLLRAKIASLDGRQMLLDSQIGSFDEAHMLAERCTQNLLAKGAKKLLDAGYL